MKTHDENLITYELPMIWKLVIVSAIATLVLFGLAVKTLAIEPSPEPTDVPFWYDPNLCPAPVVDWLVVEPGETMIYTLKYVSVAGVDVDLVVSEPNMTVLRVSKVHEPRYWMQTFELLWTSFDYGVRYIDVQARLKNGKIMDRRTILWCVEYGYLYPYDKPVVISSVGWHQQVWQRAVKEGKLPRGDIAKKPVHVWN